MQVLCKRKAAKPANYSIGKAFLLFLVVKNNAETCGHSEHTLLNCQGSKDSNQQATLTARKKKNKTQWTAKKHVKTN